MYFLTFYIKNWWYYLNLNTVKWAEFSILMWLLVSLRHPHCVLLNYIWENLPNYLFCALGWAPVRTDGWSCSHSYHSQKRWRQWWHSWWSRMKTLAYFFLSETVSNSDSPTLFWYSLVFCFLMVQNDLKERQQKRRLDEEERQKRSLAEMAAEADEYRKLLLWKF